MSKDRIYAEPLPHIQDFSFDSAVAEVFPDMIQRSVPGYQSIIQTIGTLTQHYQQADSNYYDLGCALGAASLSMRRAISSPNARIIAIDNSAAMIERAQKHLQAFRSDVPLTLELADIRDVVIENAAVVVCNFTLQFLPPSDRAAVMRNIYTGLKAGGICILSEKICADGPLGQAALTELHHEFKRTNGYSELEISQKRSALEHVMRPDTIAEHLQRLTAAGFVDSTVWFQCFNFCSMLAFKPHAIAQTQAENARL